jgi:DNA-directed RNA polymerase specialized sigma24 family protein
VGIGLLTVSSGGGGLVGDDRLPAQVTVSSAPEGFDTAFPGLFTLAYQVAFRILADRGDAEDVAQEVLARAVLRWRSLADQPGGWVAKVAANLAIDRYRRRRRFNLVRPLAVVAFDPGASLRLDLVRALRRLPRRQRQVVVLRYLADWSEQDVARELGCSLGAVKAYGSRGLQALRAGLVESPEGASDVPTP